MMPTFREQAMAALDYCPDTGLFRWKEQRCSRAARGAIAGTQKDGYVQIHVLHRVCRAHRLAWLFMTGDWPPKGFVPDHVDRDRANNRWSNLRLADARQNGLNSGLRTDNTTGCAGVYPQSNGYGWQARLFHKGRNVHIGCFPTKQAAIAARIEAANRVYGAFSPHQEQAA